MGESRRRRREIAELKRTGRRQLDTPWSSSPVLIAMADDTWLITNTEFGQALTQVQARPLTRESAADIVKELARLALWAERSGVRDDICQNWFAWQQQDLVDRAKNSK